MTSPTEAQVYSYRHLGLDNPDPIIAARLYNGLSPQVATFYVEMMSAEVRSQNRENSGIDALFDVSGSIPYIGGTIQGGRSLISGEIANAKSAIYGERHYVPLTRERISGFVQGTNGPAFAYIPSKDEAMTSIGLNPRIKSDWDTFEAILIGWSENIHSVKIEDLDLLNQELVKKDGLFSDFDKDSSILRSYFANAAYMKELPLPDSAKKIIELQLENAELRERVGESDIVARENQKKISQNNERISQLQVTLEEQSQEWVGEHLDSRLKRLGSDRKETLEEFENRNQENPIYIGNVRASSQSNVTLKAASAGVEMLGSIMNLAGNSEAGQKFVSYGNATLQIADAVQSLIEFDWSKAAEVGLSAFTSPFGSISALMGGLSVIKGLGGGGQQAMLEQLMLAISEILDNQRKILKNQYEMHVSVMYQLSLLQKALASLRADESARFDQILDRFDTAARMRDQYYLDLVRRSETIISELKIGELNDIVERLDPEREESFFGQVDRYSDENLAELADEFLKLEDAISQIRRDGRIPRLDIDEGSQIREKVANLEVLASRQIEDVFSVLPDLIEEVCEQNGGCDAFRDLLDGGKIQQIFATYIRTLGIFAQSESGKKYLKSASEFEQQRAALTYEVERLANASVQARLIVGAARVKYREALVGLRELLRLVAKVKLVSQFGQFSICDEAEITPECLAKVRLNDGEGEPTWRVLREYTRHYPTLPWFAHGPDKLAEARNSGDEMRSPSDEHSVHSFETYPRLQQMYLCTRVSSEDLGERHRNIGYENRAVLVEQLGLGFRAKPEKALMFKWEVREKKKYYWWYVIGDAEIPDYIAPQNPRIEALLGSRDATYLKVKQDGTPFPNVLETNSFKSIEYYRRFRPWLEQHRENLGTWKPNGLNNGIRKKIKKRFDKKGIAQSTDVDKPYVERIRKDLQEGQELLYKSLEAAAKRASDSVDTNWKSAIDGTTIDLADIPIIETSLGKNDEETEVSPKAVTTTHQILMDVCARISQQLERLQRSRLAFQLLLELGYGRSSLFRNPVLYGTYVGLVAENESRLDDALTIGMPNARDFLEISSGPDFLAALEQLDRSIDSLADDWEVLPEGDAGRKYSVGYSNSEQMMKLLLWTEAWRSSGMDAEDIRISNIISRNETEFS